jgi:hypothetical protein
MTKSFTEGKHPGEFILTEEDGHLSRDNVTIAESQTIIPGTILVSGAGGHAAYAAGGGAASGIAIYGATTGAGETTQIAAITRVAEVNGKCLAWPADITQDQMEAAAALLAANHIVVRGYPDQPAASPSP